MALQKTLSLNDGFGSITEVSNAYIKVLHASQHGGQIVANVGVYDRKDGTLLKMDHDVFDAAAGDLIDQTYNNLKSISFFENATDV